MNRVDYLSCRISQLRHRKLPHGWAVFLTRLELGERPAGQKHIHKIEPSKLLEMVRTELRRRRRIQWRSPMPIDESNARVLAIILRVLTTSRPQPQRTEADGVSVLTMANIEAILPLYSFFTSPRNSSRSRGLRAFERWLHRSQAEISCSHEDLLWLVDRRGLAGFAAYDG